LKEVSKDMIPLVQKSNLFVDSLNQLQLIQTVDHLKKIAQDMNSGKGTIGKLLKNDSLYANLNKAIENLNLLLIDIKAKPKRYVHFSIFGRKNK
jgi:phospholipid/cholesterol/gamma-HCH transport system substrate-binding protein